MKIQFGFGLCVAALVGLVSACGSNSDGAGDGGVAGTGAAAGTFGTSGTLAGTTGAAGTTAGNGVGTVAGNGGTAGTGNSANCPATAPADNSACTFVSTQCTYDQQQCSCEMMFGGTTAAWNCGFAATMQTCPTTAPTNGTTCEPGRGNCDYSATSVCDCNRDNNMWACWDPADCPATQPANDEACPLVGMECNYGNGGGGRQGGCDCTDAGWDCGGNFNQDDGGM
jgi:hypothetical protein